MSFGGGLEDLREMALLTGGIAGSGGVDCGDGIILATGEPIVCPGATKGNVAAAITSAVDGAFEAINPLAVCQDMQRSANLNCEYVAEGGELESAVDNGSGDIYRDVITLELTPSYSSFPMGSQR
jgi:hypothetical protein